LDARFRLAIFAWVCIAFVAFCMVAVIFIPLLGVAFLAKPKSAPPAEPGAVLRVFRCVLLVAMRTRWITILLTIACFGLALLGSPYIPRQFFPSSDRPELLVDLRL